MNFTQMVKAASIALKPYWNRLLNTEQTIKSLEDGKVDKSENGEVAIKTTSTQAFSVKDATGNEVFGVDTVNLGIKNSAFKSYMVVGTKTGDIARIDTTYNRGCVVEIQGQNYQGTSSCFYKRYLLRNIESTSVAITELENVTDGTTTDKLNFIADGEGAIISVSETSGYNINVTIKGFGVYSIL